MLYKEDKLVAMYREVVERKKMPVILMLFLIFTVILFISGFVSKVTTNYIDNIFELFVSIIMSLIIFFQVSKCKTKYKYSVIEDELIIHKLKGKEQIVLEDIRFCDIEFIGKHKGIGDSYQIYSSKKYVVSLMNTDKYCCIYKSGNQIKRFYFEPSDNLIKKIKCSRSFAV